MSDTEGGWFAGLAPGDVEGAAERVRDGERETPREWPALAVESGFAADADAYYGRLREATSSSVASRGISKNPL